MEDLNKTHLKDTCVRFKIFGSIHSADKNVLSKTVCDSKSDTVDQLKLMCLKTINVNSDRRSLPSKHAAVSAIKGALKTDDFHKIFNLFFFFSFKTINKKNMRTTECG